MLKNDVLFNLSRKDCMFITFTTKNAPLQHLIVIGHSHGLEEAWLLVLASHPRYSPPWALHSYLNPNGFPYPMPNLPTPPCCSSLANCTFSSIGISSLQDSKRKWDLPIHLLLLSVLISHVHHPWQNRHSSLHVTSSTSSSCLIWFGDLSHSTLESTT